MYFIIYVVCDDSPVGIFDFVSVMKEILPRINPSAFSPLREDKEGGKCKRKWTRNGIRGIRKSAAVKEEGEEEEEEEEQEEEE